MSKIIKRICLSIVIIAILLIVTPVSAASIEGITITFRTANKVESGNVIIDYGYVTDKDTKAYKVSYKNGETIANINTLNNATFKIKGLTKDNEWFAYNSNSKRVYFSESKQYTVKEILDLLKVKKCSDTVCNSLNYKEITLYSNSDPIEEETTKSSDNTLKVIEGEEYLFNSSKNRMILNASFTLGMSNKELASEYSSTDPSVCTVTELGVVNAINLGVCKIIGKKDGNEYTWEGKIYELGSTVKEVSIEKNDEINVPLKFTDVNGNSKDHPLKKYKETLKVTWKYEDGSAIDKKVLKIKYSEGSLSIKGLADHKKKNIDIYINGVKGLTIPVEAIDNDNVYFDIKFLDTSSDRGANSIIINTGKGKDKEYHYVLIDTALANGSFTCSNLVSQIKEFMIPRKDGKYVLDNIIISHDHGDHTGCLSEVMKAFNVKGKQVIQKDESNKNGSVECIACVKGSIAPESFGKVSGNKVVKTLQNVTFNIYNYEDQYENKACKETFEPVIFFEPRQSMLDRVNNKKIKLLTTSNGKYYAVKASDTSKIVKITEEQLNTYIANGTPKDKNQKLWVAVQKLKSNKTITKTICNKNANSLAILLKVKINNEDKYIYIPGDLQNNGYPFAAIKSSKEGITTSKNYVIKSSESEKVVAVTNNRESEVAKQIKDDLGSEISNIVIYQESHHGYNNALKAMQHLGFTNNQSLYVIGLSNSSDKKAINGWKQRTYFFTLGGTDKNKYLYTGASSTGAIEFRVDTKNSQQVVTLKTNTKDEEITL